VRVCFQSETESTQQQSKRFSRHRVKSGSKQRVHTQSIDDPVDMKYFCAVVLVAACAAAKPNVYEYEIEKAENLLRLLGEQKPRVSEL